VIAPFLVQNLSFSFFDDVRWKSDMKGSMYSIDSEEAHWNTGRTIDGGNLGHRPRVKGGYFPVPPVDSSHEMRASMCNTLQAIGLEVEVHHHEVATACQNEIGVRFNSLKAKADEVQVLKICGAQCGTCLWKNGDLYAKTARR
jgi:glutamine synthetase